MAIRSDREKILDLFASACLFQRRVQKAKHSLKKKYQKELRDTALQEAERYLDACELSIAFMISVDVFAGKIDRMIRRFLLRYILFRIVEVERCNRMDLQEIIEAIQRNVFSSDRLQEILKEVEKKKSVFGVVGMNPDDLLKIQQAALRQLNLRNQCMEM